jgi:hypothetical protein
MSDVPAPPAPGMSAATAGAIRNAIIGICIAGLVLIFQPFSLELFGIGCGLVILGGLAFNLVPLCEPGQPLRSVAVAAAIVVALLFLVAGLAILSAWLYGIYFVGQ